MIQLAAGSGRSGGFGLNDSLDIGYRTDCVNVTSATELENPFVLANLPALVEAKRTP